MTYVWAVDYALIYAPLFLSLFNAIDEVGDKKREEAEKQGRVEKEIIRDDYYLDLPEGEHASEASIEVEFSEVTDLTKEQKWEVVDLCYQCKLCDPICPYTPGEGT